MTNEIATTESTNAIQLANLEAANAVAAIISAQAGATYCSIENDGTREAQSKFFNALNNPEGRVSDCINQTIKVQDVLIEMRDLTNEETGEIARVPRVVLIDDKGKGWQATSIGIYTVVKNAFYAFGKAPWKPALEFTIKQKPTKNGSMLTAEIR